MKAERLPLAAIQSNAAQVRNQYNTSSLNSPNTKLGNQKEAAVHEQARQHSHIPKVSSVPRPSDALRKWSMRDFEIGRKLGRGKFGRVLLVRVKHSGFVCALKTMHKEELVRYRAEVQFRREVEIQASLQHPNILQIYGYFEDQRKVYIMVEYAPKGELYAILGEKGRFEPATASHYIAQVASGLHYCHRRNIMHRDIKPENLLMGIDGRVKISDFGWSIRSRHKRGTLCGTLDYLPPEMISKEAHTHLVDTWALGVLTYEFLTGEAPFFAEGRQLTYSRIQRVDLKFPSYVEPEAIDFIKGLLQRDPARRMSLRDVPSHPWMLKYAKSWKFEVL